MRKPVYMPENPYKSPQAIDERVSRPLWVRIKLWGTRSRNGALAFCCGTLAVGIAFAIYSIVDPDALAGTALFAAALWYWLAIRWVDQHDRWTPID